MNLLVGRIIPSHWLSSEWLRISQISSFLGLNVDLFWWEMMAEFQPLLLGSLSYNSIDSVPAV